MVVVHLSNSRERTGVTHHGGRSLVTLANTLESHVNVTLKESIEGQKFTRSCVVRQASMDEYQLISIDRLFPCMADK